MFKLINASILIIIFFYFIRYSFNAHILKYKEYIDKCKQKKFIIQEYRTKPQNIFLSVSIPAYNMENYIESALLSLINQSFKDFEIIIVNDNSIDNTENIIKQIQFKDKRIKYINHLNNLGVYASRVDGILNAEGKYIILLDPDDLLMNQDLFQELYNYNLENTFDIIEFLVYHKKEGRKNIFFPKDHKLNHYHNYQNHIINQPELSDIIFYNPNSKEYSSIICRSIWNKLIKKEIILKSINYLNNDYFRNQYLIAADDTPLNILSFQFANNYSNINLPGYLYNLREDGMSRDKKGNIKHDIILSYNFLLYFKFLYNYIKTYKKDINFFFYDFIDFFYTLLILKDLNVTMYIPIAIEFFKKVNEGNIKKDFRKFVEEKIIYFSK